MTDELTVLTERVDDLPVLIASLEKLELAALTDQHISSHGNWHGLYAGNPTRVTHRPTTELMLRAFKDVFLSLVTVGTQTHVHLSPLSDLQQKILHLLELPLEIYTRLASDSFKPP